MPLLYSRTSILTERFGDVERMKSIQAAIIPALAASVAETNDIRAIKPPVEVPNEWAWLWWVAGAVILIALAVAALYWWHWRRSRPVSALMVPPHVRARQRLQQAWALISDARLFCIAVSDALRVYLEERFNLQAPERTTEEFLAELQSTGVLSPEQKQSLGEFLQHCDLVKFARHEPPESDLRQLHDAALRLVDETQFESVNAPGIASGAGSEQVLAEPEREPAGVEESK